MNKYELVPERKARSTVDWVEPELKSWVLYLNPTYEYQAFTPTLQKSEGFRVKASEGEVVVLYFKPSATQNLKSSGFPEGETTWQNRPPSFEFTNGGIQEFVILI